jgi:DNA-binding MarR family transcriptional regulator
MTECHVWLVTGTSAVFRKTVNATVATLIRCIYIMHMHHRATAIDLPCACTTLRKATRAVSRIYDEALAAAGMNVTQLAILRAIGRAADGGAPLSRLAEDLVMDNTSLYRGLGPLIRSRWVVVTQAGKGRTKLVRLTPKGQRVTDAATEPWEAAQSKVVEAFGVKRWAALHKSITDLAAVGVRLG